MKFIWTPLVLCSLFFSSCDQVEKERKQQAAISEMEDLGNETKARLERELSEGGLTGESASESIGNMIGALDDVGANGNSSEQALVAAMKPYLEEGQAVAAKLAEGAKKLQMAMNYSTVKSAEDIEALSALTRDYRTMNAEVKERVTKGMLDDLKSRIDASAASAADKKVGYESVRKVALQQRPHLGVIRDTDDKLCGNILAQHSLLKENWGNWTWDERTGQFTFQTDEALEKYNVLVGELQEIAAEQAEAQRKLIATM